MTEKYRTNPSVHASTGGAYILAMIGAAVYYISVAHGFGEVVVALLKALVWPAFLTYDVLKFIAP